MSSNGGICAIKKEFVKEVEATTESSTTEIAVPHKRGMNKGAEREHSILSAKVGEKPSFEGEINFLSGEALHGVKNAIRGDKGQKRDRETFTRPDGTPMTEVEAAIERRKRREGESLEENKAAAAAQKELLKTTVEQKRENAANRDALFRKKLILSPLTTVGNLPFRRICAEYGADNTVSEMALIYNLNRTQPSEWSLLRRHTSETCFGLQVAVSKDWDAETFAKSIAASGFSYDYIDINCGCPVDLIVSKGCGCGLWEKKARLRSVVKALVDYQPKPVTIKCRIGDDESDPQLHKQIAEYEGWGASAVTIHGRSRRQRYTKLANWDYVERCAKLTQLPVIGNGDIMSHIDVNEHKAACPTIDSYMLGRGALIKPWVFQEIKEQRAIDMSSSERFAMLEKFCKYGLSHWGSDERGVQTTRKFLCEWLSFLHRYVPYGILEQPPQRVNERPPLYVGRDNLETLMASDASADWVRISEMILGPAGDAFKFTPKHKSNSYSTPMLPHNAPVPTVDELIEG